MTYKAFLAALRKTKRTWRVEPDGLIRCAKGACPMGVLMKDHPTPGPALASEELGLKYSTAYNIMCGADSPLRLLKKKSEHQARRDLLRACGLKERP